MLQAMLKACTVNLWQIPASCLRAGVLVAFIFPGLLAASLEEELGESRAMRRTRG